MGEGALFISDLFTREYMNNLTQIVFRIVATFAATGLSVVGAGSLVGIEVWKACLMAGIGGVSFVVEGLARAYLDDGKLTIAEINEVFQKADKRANKGKPAEETK